jgi:hypothetical protein
MRWRPVRRIGLRFVGFRLHWFCVSNPETVKAVCGILFWIANGFAKNTHRFELSDENRQGIFVAGFTD